jgi:regulator of cell morphogenesis and NO signaling
MDILPQTSISKLVVDLPPSMLFFDRWNIDYCFQGQLTLASAAEAAGLELAEVLSELRRLNQQTAAPNWNERTLTELIGHLSKVHHAFTARSLTGLRPAVTKVLLTHGPVYDFLSFLSEATEGLFANLERHMDQENDVLFPMILKLDRSGEVPTELKAIYLDLEGEHIEIGDHFRLVREITADYKAPDDACTTLRALYSGLMELEKDMKVHIHLENNVLLPRVRELMSR